MRFLLDTTVVVPYLADDAEAIDFLRRLANDGFALSILVYLEVFEGVVTHLDPASSHRKFEAFVGNVPVLPVSIPIARRCAQIRADLRQQGKNPRRRPFDLVIAATALEHDLELVTHSVRDDQDVPDLVVRTPLT